MIFCFTIRTQESPEFLMEIQLDGKHTFHNFHQIIQLNCDYQSHQLASFFLLDKKHNKKVEISLLDTGVSSSAFYSMHKTRIIDFLVEKGQKLVYTFDFIDDRSLFIELTDIIMEKNLNEPYVALFRGDAPVQVLEDYPQRAVHSSVEEKAYQDYGVLDDYAQIFGEMDEF